MKVKAYSIASAAANISERGQKAIWQDKVTGVVFFGDLADLPKSALSKCNREVGYIELSEKELLEQESKRFHF